MHELSITQHMLNIVVDHAQRAGAKRVIAIHLVVGELTGFIDDSIQFYFDMLSPDTIAAGATLNIRRVSAHLRCRVCGAEFAPKDSNWLCPQCSAVGGDVLAGREFLIESIEIQ
ncbi:MAG: hydrogenase maturation nickel metallochaperone HypA [Candidatus Hadarchaeum sp.]